MDSQWTVYLPRVGAHNVVSLVNLQRTVTGATVGRHVDTHACRRFSMTRIANSLSFTRSMMRDMYERLTLLGTQIERYDELIRQAHKASVLSQRQEKIRGVGPMIATAVIAAAGSATEFTNGQQFAAWIGLTPRQRSSGGKQRLFGITKWGNAYLRMLLVHGARSVVQQAVRHSDGLPRWILEVQANRQYDQS